MYVKNHTFKTGVADDCDCAEILSQIEEAYRLYENKEDGVIKVSITNG